MSSLPMRRRVARWSSVVLAGAFALACDGGGDGSGGGAELDASVGEDGGGGRQDSGGQGDTGVILVDSSPPVDQGGADAVPADAGATDAGETDAGETDGAPPPDCNVGDTRPCEDVACAGGVQTCTDGAWAACVGPAETCNGQDDDCDGQSDETFADVGEACANGFGACETTGTVICAPGGDGTVCNAVPGAPSPEVCDGVDNDCDGTVDVDANGAPLGAPCYEGPAGTEGVGSCAAGRRVCGADGQPGACVDQVLPVAEVCNGADDDCDGLTDVPAGGGTLTQSCYDGPAGTDGVGLCRGGTRECANGAFGACERQVVPALEICDSQDNDCNGAVDDAAGAGCACQPGSSRECYSGPEGTAGRGICRAGSQVCAEDGSTYGPCLEQRLPEAESCNAIDDDCNGAVDDAVEGVGAACTDGEGACLARGVTTCDAETGRVSCNARPGQPADERCDTLDNDCDGNTDESLGLGDPCAVGVGACAALGEVICNGEGGTACNVEPGLPQAEVCDDVDNDCNGETDDGIGLGEACTAGVGECAREGRRICAEDGAVVCDAEAGGAADEVCDGLDNDCDGAVDQGNPGGGGGCELPLLGVCANGVLACVGGELACQSVVEPAPETCDGLDNDCNGGVDDGANGAALSERCYEGPRGTEGVGVCAAGARTCANGRFGGCDEQVLPGEEICDTLDNDCNGQADDLPGGARCACQPGEVQACYSGPEGTEGVGACVGGRQTCNRDGRSFGPCIGEELPGAEQCNGSDDDCNGRVDDAIPGTGVACEAGVGVCLARGVVVCNGRTGEVSCDAVPGEPVAERCDRLDNDCNGAADDGIGLGDACAAGVGACRANGRNVCAANGDVTCNAVPGQPVAERCDAIDNDCDGVVDDGLRLGERCTAGRGACLREGVRICGANGTVVCSAVAGAPQPEACDGIDNDCDGTVDDGNPGGGQQCVVPNVQGACAVGTRVCQAGNFVCNQVVQPAPETCDAVDNDCNGRVDDGANGGAIQRACYTGPAGTQGIGVCVGGAQTCANGRFGACDGEVVPSPEICDQRDNDCNGRADDLAGGRTCECRPGTTRACYTGPAGTQNTGICRAGTQTCVADGTSYGACQNEVLPAVEICDGLDNDCNGRSDDVRGAGDACTNGVGECVRDGRLACDPRAGALVCDAIPGRPRPEICDGLDNDCNNVPDDVEGIGRDCTSGNGACERPGTLVCDVRQLALVCNAVPGAPAAEVCNGIDDDCNRVVDDRVPGVGRDCSIGVGECTSGGLTICEGANGIVCGAEVIDPVPESCDGLDNDCDGESDDLPIPGIGDRCAVGVGVCQRQGVTVCGAGDVFCDAVAGQPTGPDLCNRQDDDCDGRVDEGLDCTVYRSCLDALGRGVRASGIYVIQPNAAQPSVSVYCDQAADGGGWTLVGSTRDQTLNDQSAAWYADLTTLAPAQANAGIWGGLRDLSQHHDVRFACRPAVGAANAPFAVDLSMYRNNWYAEWTTGDDTASCFNDNNGVGEEVPPPARRNNLTGAFVQRGTAWSFGYHEGEDVCSDSTDFTVDFNDRGMDSNQSDGTDWGEDDGARKCGNSGLAGGQWFVFARERRRVAVVGPVTVAPVLVAAGIPAEVIALRDIVGRLLPDRYESVFFGRYAEGRFAELTPAAQTTLNDFTALGGSIVTEWDGLSALGNRFSANYRFPAGAIALDYFPYATGAGGQHPGSGPITPVAPLDAIFSNVPNPLRVVGATEFFFTVNPIDNGVDTLLRSVATIPGVAGNNQFPNPPAAHAAVLRGSRCGGTYIFANHDYQDDPRNAGFGSYLRNLGEQSLLPPSSALQDACRVGTRPIVLVCGSSDVDVNTFIRGRMRGQVQVIPGCSPDARTQAMLITRTGPPILAPLLVRNPALLADYVAGGGIIVGEYSASDEIYNGVFRPAAPVVQSAAQSGFCVDNVQPAVVFNPRDQFWADNLFEPVAANRTGCGFDLAAFPGITPLGGNGGAVVSTAYRDLGFGRVWFNEVDWQDAQAKTEQTLGLLHYMIFHGRDSRPAVVIQ